MTLKKYLLHLPPWSRRESGLFVPTESPRPIFNDSPPDLPVALKPTADAFIVIGRQASALEQIRVFVDEVALGLPVSTLRQLNAAVEQLACEPTLEALAKVNAEVHHLRGDTIGQVELARRILDSPALVSRIERFVSAHPGGVEVFTEQHLTALQRLVVLNGKTGPIGNDVGKQQIAFNAAVFGVTALTREHELADTDPEESVETWLTYFVQNGAYFRVNSGLGEMTRAQILLGDIANEEASQNHPDACELDEWMEADYGFTREDQFVLGMSTMAVSKILDDDADLSTRSLIRPDFLPDIADRLGRNVSDAHELIVGDREWYQTRFNDGPQTRMRAAWERIPFEQRPLMSLTSGSLLLMSPQAINSWIGDGFYHRVLECARKRSQVPRFQRFYGFLVEQYVRRVLESVSPPKSRIVTQRIEGEKEYGSKRRRIKSPDVTIALGTDLILIEITSGRFTQGTLLDGDSTVALRDMRNLLFKKLDQLGDRTQDLLDGLWIPEGSSLKEIERIWPVIVTADLTQNELLWDQIDADLPESFSDARVAPLTLFDLSDIELWVANAEAGAGLLNVLSRRANSEFRRLELRRFVQAERDLALDARPSMLEHRWDELSLVVARKLGFDEEPIREWQGNRTSGPGP